MENFTSQNWHLELNWEAVSTGCCWKWCWAGLLPEVLAGFTPCQLIAEGCWTIRKQGFEMIPREVWITTEATNKGSQARSARGVWGWETCEFSLSSILWELLRRSPSGSQRCLCVRFLHTLCPPPLTLLDEQRESSSLRGQLISGPGCWQSSMECFVADTCYILGCPAHNPPFFLVRSCGLFWGGLVSSPHYYALGGTIKTGILPSSGQWNSPSWTLSWAVIHKNGTKSVGEDLTPGPHSTFTIITRASVSGS